MEGEKTNGPFHVQEAANFYNVFDDLFGDAYFIPVTSLDVRYSSGKQNEVETRVYSGNMIAPREVRKIITI